MKKIISLLLIIYLPFSSFSQDTIISSLPQITICPGNVIIPVSVENFNNIASISLIIKYDTSYLKYQSYENLNPVFNSGLFFINATNQQIIISWFSLQPVTIGNGSILDLKFEYLGHSPIQLNWDVATAGSCVYTDLDGNELPSKFFNGIIENHMQIPGILNPPNFAINQPTNLGFSWTGSNCAPHYELQISEDSTFQQVSISQNSIFGTTIQYNGLTENTNYFSRIRGYNPYDTTLWSTIVRFKTKGPDAINETEKNAPLSIQYINNPVTDNIKLNLFVNKYISLNIRLVNATGNQFTICECFRPVLGKSELLINTNNYSAGSYYLILYGSTSTEQFRICKKFIIQ